MPESEGPPGEPLDYAGFASALPTFGEEERSPLFPGFCQNEHFPAEALNNSFEKEKPCTPSPAHPLEEEEKLARPERESAPPIKLTPASSAAMMMDAPPLGCSLD